MANDLSLKIRIGAELTEIKNGLRQVQADLDKLGQKGRNAGGSAAQGMGKLEQAVVGAQRALGLLATAYAAIAGGSKFIQMADEVKLLDARLKLASRTTEEYVRAQGLLFDLAQRTRSSLGETINLYSRLAQATKEAGVSQDELVRVTETINKAVQLSGASAEAANAALIQLGQGIASGTLRGEELNSVLEQTPRLAQAIAEGMGITVGELRKYGQEGKLSGEQVLKALENQGAKIDAEFSQLPVTVGQAMTMVGNSVMRAAGEIDGATGLTGGLAQALQDLSAWLDTGVLADGMVDTMTRWSTSLGETGGDVRELIGEIADLFGLTQQDGTDAADAVLDAFKNLPANIRAFIQIIVVEVASMLDKIIVAGGAFVDRMKALVTDDTIAEVNERTAAEYERINQARQDSIDNILKERQASIDAGKAAVDSIRAERTEREKAAKAPGHSAPAATGAKKPVAQARVDQLALLQDQIKRELDINEEGYKAGEVALRDYYARRQALQLQAIDTEIAEKQRAMAALDAEDAKGRSKILTDLELLQRQKADVIRKTGGEQAAAEKEVAEKAAQAQLEALQQRLSTIGDRLQASEQSTANRIATGEISQPQGQEENRAAREQAIADLQALRAEFAALAETSPQAAQALGEIDQQLAQINAENITGTEAALRRMRTELANLEANFAGNAIENLSDGLGNALADIATGAKSAGDAFKDMARNFLASLAQMAAQALAKKAILAMFGGPGGLFAGVLHTGGIAGMSGGTVRNVPAFAFANAPRYHSGGIAGLKPGEVPAVLQQGEEVLTKSDPRHSLNGGGQAGGGNNGVRVVNVIDPNLVQDYLTSSAGERTILNVVERNAGAIKQKLG